jgi:N-acetylglucosamine-6-sulfatase
VRHLRGTIGLLLLISAVLPSLIAPRVGAQETSRPNILLILTDDQRFDSLFVMQHVQNELMAHGITFRRAMVTNSLCCPSRASILTGGFSHTTGVYTNKYTTRSPYGGWPAFHATGDENGTIAVALEAAGYRTGLFGKYLNDYPGTQVPPGWDRFAGFAGDRSGGGAYYDYSMLVKDAIGTRTETFGSSPSDYSTNVIEAKTMAFLRGTDPASPFFAYVAPFAPHSKIVPAPKDVGSFDGYTQTLPPSFNERDVADKPPYIRERRTMSATAVENHYRLQYESLQAVDRMVGRFVGYLRSSGQLSNTMIVFMSDNGLQYGEHRWPYKLVPYQESIRVPMVIRYDPLTASAGTSGVIVANIDIAPTFADIAGIGSTYRGVGSVDGLSLVPLLDGSVARLRSNLLLEHLDYPTQFHVPAYCGIRTATRLYVRYSGGFEELYRLGPDPYELRNLASNRPPDLPPLRALARAECVPLPPGFVW